MFKKRGSKKDNTKIKVNSFNSKTIPIRDNGDNYYYVDTFEQITEKECKKYDKFNQLIYEKYNNIYNKINNKIDDCPFKLDKKPEPPKSPNNYESLIKWKAMNEIKNVSHQTVSTLFLLNRKKQISLDFDKYKITPSDIIDVAFKESNSDYDLMKKEANSFLDSLLNKPSNQEVNQEANQEANQEHITPYRRKTIGNIYKTSDIDKSNSSLENIHFGFTTQSTSITNNKLPKRVISTHSYFDNEQQHNNINTLKCQTPEHHSINDKYAHFNNLSKTNINTKHNNPNPNPNPNHNPHPHPNHNPNQNPNPNPHPHPNQHFINNTHFIHNPNQNPNQNPNLNSQPSAPPMYDN